ncbi:hypothetical protein WDJ51_11055 [Rathayibacter sp. YIM 133350]|uniref:hypothetical protein n=1 Tax=Rathayibacter sp. YIM 133350 TaxID=3131992 RepID=UPI00307E35BA
MASLRVHQDRLEIHLTAAERVLALRREDIVVRRDEIRSVAITDDPWIWIRGIRAPGTAVPLTLALGTWKFHGGKDFLVVKNKRQAVVIDIAEGEFSRVIVSTPHAVDLISSLKISEDPSLAVDSSEATGSEAPVIHEAMQPDAVAHENEVQS